MFVCIYAKLCSSLLFETFCLADVSLMVVERDESTARLMLVFSGHMPYLANLTLIFSDTIVKSLKEH